MAIFGSGQTDPKEVRSIDVRSRQIRDYASVGMNLFWQRQMSIAAALALAGFYYSFTFALLTCALIAISETFDYFVFRKILQIPKMDTRQSNITMGFIYLGTVASAGVISFYAIWISLMQGHSTHFMALFFLFAAALFAAMNNHHLLSVLVLRLSIYGATFLFIPLRDIIMTGASIHSELWAQLFASVFVVYFIIDCSRIYLSFYRLTMRQMDELSLEHETTKSALLAKSQFVSTMSHEMRTPMTVIKASVDMAYSGKLGEVPDKVKDVLGIAQRSCTRLVSLINEVLDLQKIESGNMGFSFETLEVGALLEEAVEANRPYADKFGVVVQFDRQVIPQFVPGDQQRLAQVLANLLSNAAKFSPRGSMVTIQTQTHGANLRILVADEGIGISEQDHDRVFDQFTQLVSDDRKAQGTGLGMNISKRIVEAHGGRIWFTKNTGPGTTFWVEIRRIDPAAVGNPAGESAVDLQNTLPATE